ncbi:MAG: Hpt domain-containing protein [Armatimonadetes bacterium]|nr:Hpt domain-containing protein [Armatimonadota bacterium]
MANNPMEPSPPATGDSPADRSMEEMLLDRMRGPYLESVSRKVEALAVLLCRSLAEGSADAPEERSSSPSSDDSTGVESPLQEALRLAHSMAGSGASYGFPGISTRSRALEREIHAYLQRDEESPDLSALLDLLLRVLHMRSALTRATEGDP